MLKEDWKVSPKAKTVRDEGRLRRENARIVRNQPTKFKAKWNDEGIKNYSGFTPRRKLFSVLKPELPSVTTYSPFPLLSVSTHSSLTYLDNKTNPTENQPCLLLH